MPNPDGPTIDLRPWWIGAGGPHGALDPHDLLDEEAHRIEAHLAGLAPPGWSAPTRCAEWTVHDLLAHLDAAEEYHRACLDGRLGRFFAAALERGATDRESHNALGVADRRAVLSAELLERWRASNAETRRLLRARDGGELDTSVGRYPVRLQALHLAHELAVHADDLGVPVTPAEAERRLRWRVEASRFLLLEAEPDLEVDPCGEGTCICIGIRRVVLDDTVLVEAVAGRLGDEPVDRLLRSALDVRA